MSFAERVAEPSFSACREHGERTVKSMGLGRGWRGRLPHGAIEKKTLSGLVCLIAVILGTVTSQFNFDNGW